MSRKHIFLYAIHTILSLVSLIGQEAPCTTCDCIVERAKALLEATPPQYEMAIKKYQAAKECDPERAEYFDQQIVDIFKTIDSLRVKAEDSEERAKKALKQAEEQKQKAEAATRQAQAAQAQAEKETQKAIANDLAYKADGLLRDGLRTEAFHLAAFADRFVDPDNLKAGRVLHDAYYYNNTPERQKSDSLQKNWCTNFIGHRGSVSAANFSSDGRYIVTGSGDGTAKVWEVSTSRELKTLSGHTDYVSAANFSSNGRYIVTGSGDGTAKVWEVSTSRELKTLAGHTGEVSAANFSSDGHYIVTGSSDGTAKVWEVSTGRVLKTLSGHKGYVSAANFSSDGRYIVTGSSDGTAKVWEVSTGRVLKTLSGHKGSVSAANFSSDGRYIVTGSRDGTAKVWEVSTGRELKTLSGHSGNVSAANFSSDGRYIVTGSWDSTAKVWEVSTGHELKTLSGQSGSVSAANFSSDGRYIVTGSWDGTAKVWEVSTGRELKTLSGHTADVSVVNFSPDGRYIVTGGCRDRKVYPIYDGISIPAESSDKTAKVWEVSSGRELKTLSGPSGNVLAANISSDGCFIVTGGRYRKTYPMSDDSTIPIMRRDGTAKVWDLSSGRELKTFLGHTGEVSAANFSSNGRYIVTGSSDKTAKVWEISTGRELKTLSGHTGEVSAANFSSNGRYIVTGSSDKTAKVWEISTGRELKTLSGHTGEVSAANFSSNGRYIVTGSSDKTAKVWEISTGRELKTLSGHTGEVSAANFSSNGRYIVTGSSDKTAKVWEISTGRELKTLSGHTRSVNAANFSSDGRYIVTGSSDNTAKVWINGKAELLAAPPPYYFSPDFIKKYDLYLFIASKSRWKKFLTKANPNQLKVIGLYLQWEGRSNNNPAIFNDYYAKAIACFQTAFGQTSHPIHRNYLSRCYLDWAQKHFNKKNHREAVKMIRLALEFGTGFENHRLAYQIAEAQGKSYDISAWLAFDNARDLGLAGDFLHREKGPEAAIPFYEKVDSIQPTFKNGKKLYLVSKELGRNYDVSHWLSFDNAYDLGRASDFLHRENGAEAALPFYEKAYELKPTFENDKNLYIVTKELGKPYDVSHWLDFDNAFDLGRAGDFLHREKGAEAALPLYEKVNELNPTFENDQKLFLVSKELGKAYDVSLWLAFENADKLGRAGDFLHREIGAEAALPFYEKVDRINPNPANTIKLYEIALSRGEDRFEAYFFSDSLAEVKAYIQDFNRSYPINDSTNLIKFHRIYRLIEHALTLEDTPALRKQYSMDVNSYGWYQLLTGDFVGCEQTIRRGMALDSTNQYFKTNLPPALLFQGKYEAARQLYRKWAPEKWVIDSRHKTIADAFLDDFKTFEEKPAIQKIMTPELEEQIEAIRVEILEPVLSRKE